MRISPSLSPPIVLLFAFPLRWLVGCVLYVISVLFLIQFIHEAINFIRL